MFNQRAHIGFQCQFAYLTGCHLVVNDATDSLVNHKQLIDSGTATITGVIAIITAFAMLKFFGVVQAEIAANDVGYNFGLGALWAVQTDKTLAKNADG